MERRALIAAVAVLLLAGVFVSSSQAPAPATHTSRVKPVDVTDYNGTYTGAPGTGSVGYSTLWRDNYRGDEPGFCNGEGCGSHPGADIPVPSGTSVRAALSGTVVISRCRDDGWGGLIVTQSISPYNSNETVYVTYAHLRTRYYGVDSYVSAGTVIGKSGGDPNEVCAGSSSGSHLHFQVDKAGNSMLPWAPSDMNRSDSDFTVTRYTYNPIPFVTGQYHWTFDQAGHSEYWTPVNVSWWDTRHGRLIIDGNADPWIWRNNEGTVYCSVGNNQCSSAIAAEASIYRYVATSLETMCVENPAKVFFTTSESGVWDEAKSVTFTYSGPATYYIYMAGNSNWRGVITGLRIDPAGNCNPNASDPSLFYSIRIVR